MFNRRSIFVFGSKQAAGAHEPRQVRTPFRKIATGLSALSVAMPLTFSGCAAPNTSAVSAFGQCQQTSSALRRTHSELDDSPAWISDAAGPEYDASIDRTDDYYDSDISGAPPHTAPPPPSGGGAGGAGGGGGGGGGRPPVGYSSKCSSPLGADRRPSSLGLMITFVCTYRETTPGVQDPTRDTLLGCDISSIGGVSQPPPPPSNAKGGTVAVHAGKPIDFAACSGSPMAIGDTISILSTPDTNIADMNTLWNGNKVEGWMYLGDDGKRYIQFNYANQAGKSAALSFGIASGSVSSAGGYSSINLWNGQLPPGTRVKTCFSKGKQLA